MLTEYDKRRHDGVKAFVEALRRLEEKGILKHCGKFIFYIYTFQALTSKAHNNILFMVSATLAVETMRQGKKVLLKMTFSMYSIMYQQRMCVSL
jgi:hypothetical protein